jgi:hemolysin III
VAAVSRTPRTPDRATQDETARPLLRGRIHEAAFWMALVAGPALVLSAPAGYRLSTAIYATTLVLLLGTSALYHRVTWRPGPRALMRRLDHAMIFLLIAGTYTVAARLALPPEQARMVLAVVWAGAVAGVVLSVLWPATPKPLLAAVALVVGWVAVAVLPDLADGLASGEMGLIAAGGILYSLGALAYATKRPNPVPGIAGYHEVFHVLVVLAAACHYAAVALALP